MNALKQAGNAVRKHSPEILTALGVAGMVTTVVLAVRATPKAMVLLEEHMALKMKEEYGEFGAHEVLHPDWNYLAQYTGPKEVIKIAWKPYVPAMIMGSITIACIIGGQKVTSSRAAALASAYSLSEVALKEYENKVVETIGKNKEEKMRAEMIQEKVNADPPELGMTLPTPDMGHTLCYDVFSGRYFYSDAETLRGIVNDFNQQLLHECEMSLNEFYYMIGLPEIPLGANLCWRAEEALCEIQFTAVMAEDTNTPCLAIDYKTVPRYF